jgi:hypothetical protein
MESRDFARESVRCEWDYYDLCESTRALVTFQQYLSMKNPRWSTNEITFWVNQIKEYRASAASWRETQSNPTPIRSTQLCYNCKVPWEPDHRCRGKDQKHIIEAHYDSDDEVCEDGAIDVDLGQSNDDSDSCTEVDDTSTLEEDGDPRVVDRQPEGHDDSTYASADISHGVDDPTPQQSGDISGGLHVLAPRPDELPMRDVTHLPSFQAPTIATSHEDISSMSDMMEEPCVRDAHHGHVDPQIQEEVQDVQTVDLTHTDQHEEMESQILEIPLVEQIGETDRLMELLLPGSVCIDEDALFSGQDDHSTCLDTSIWDPDADDSSRVSAQEDTAAHTGYSVIQREIAPSDGVQWHTGGPSSTVDSGQFNTISSAERVFGDSKVDTSNEGYEVAPQHDCDQESHHLAAQLRVSEDMIMAATRRSDDMHTWVTDYYWRASVTHDSSNGGFAMDDFHTLRERVSMMRTNYQQLLTDRDYLLRIGETYH